LFFYKLDMDHLPGEIAEIIYRRCDSLSRLRPPVLCNVLLSLIRTGQNDLVRKYRYLYSESAAFRVAVECANIEIMDLFQNSKEIAIQDVTLQTLQWFLNKNIDVVDWEDHSTEFTREYCRLKQYHCDLIRVLVYGDLKTIKKVIKARNTTKAHEVVYVTNYLYYKSFPGATFRTYKWLCENFPNLGFYGRHIIHMSLAEFIEVAQRQVPYAYLAELIRTNNIARFREAVNACTKQVELWQLLYYIDPDMVQSTRAVLPTVVHCESLTDMFRWFVDIVGGLRNVNKLGWFVEYGTLDMVQYLVNLGERVKAFEIANTSVEKYKIYCDKFGPPDTYRLNRCKNEVILYMLEQKHISSDQALKLLHGPIKITNSQLALLQIQENLKWINDRNIDLWILKKLLKKGYLIPTINVRLRQLYLRNVRLLHSKVV
jgi:hypothetical protein